MPATPKTAIVKAVNTLMKSQMRRPKNNKRKQKKRKRALLENTSVSSRSSSNYAFVAEGIDMDYLEPKQGRGPNGGHYVCNRELVLSNISFGATTGFTITQQFNFNPGLAGVLPWLSNIGTDYTSYRIHGLSLVYIPIAGTGTQGDVVVYPAFNPLAAAPSTEIAVVNNKDAVTRVVWKSWRKILDPNDLMGGMTRKTIRAGNIAGDLKTYDGCRVYIGSNNAADSSAKPIGKLFVEYEIEFFDPVVQLSTVLQPSYTTQFYNSAADPLPTGSATALSLSLVPGYNGLNIAPPSAGTIFLPAGVYRLTASFCYQDTANETFTVFQQFYYNNGALTNTRGQVLCRSTGVGTQANNLVSDILLTVPPADVTSGANYIFVVATATGSAGTLSCLTGGSLIITPA